MKPESPISAINSLPRCSHTTPSGRRCRLLASDSGFPFCHRHQPSLEELTTAELTAAAGSLSTPEEINRFLTCVTLLRVRGRLTPREACTYAFLCQILQRGQREIAFHQELQAERAERAAEKARVEEVVSWRLERD